MVLIPDSVCGVIIHYLECFSLTSEPRMFSKVFFWLISFYRVQAKVTYFAGPATVNQAVSRSQVTMSRDWTVVYCYHALEITVIKYFLHSFSAILLLSTNTGGGKKLWKNCIKKIHTWSHDICIIDQAWAQDGYKLAVIFFGWMIHAIATDLWDWYWNSNNNGMYISFYSQIYLIGLILSVV